MRLPGRRQRLLILAALLLLLAGVYGLRINARHKAEFISTSSAPNGAYRLDAYSLHGGQKTTLLLRVFDREQRLVGEYSRDYPGGNFRPEWECGEQTCTELWWDTHDEDRIALPPTQLDQLRARLP